MCAERKLFTRKCLSWTHPFTPLEVFSEGFVKGSSKLNFDWLRTTNRHDGCGERTVKLTPCFGAATWFFFFSHLLLLFLYCFYRRCSVQWVAYRGTLPKEQNASSCSLLCLYRPLPPPTMSAVCAPFHLCNKGTFASRFSPPLFLLHLVFFFLI